MKITRDMKIKEVLAFDEEKMLQTLMWLAPEFERLRYPRLRRAMSGRVSVAQAARVARIPVTEMLYALNLALGEDEAELSAELFLSDWEDFEYHEQQLPVKPFEIAYLQDKDANVRFIDLMPQHEEKRDPMPAIIKALKSLQKPHEILLIRHPFDPVPLRDMLARKGWASWAEERCDGEWYIYFYRPQVSAKVTAHPPVNNRVLIKCAGAFAV